MKRVAGTILLVLVLSVPALAADATKSNYRGWESLALRNGIVEVQVAPAIGGRVIQLKLGEFEYLWVNPELVGKPPTPTGLGPAGEWLNYGGDKLWPAPQGWSGDQEWPGPPDAVLDGSPHAAAIDVAGGDRAAVRLTSRDDPRSGIHFSRVIQVFDGAARVSFDSTMKNIDKKPRRWGIWQVTQLSAANRSGEGYNKEIRCYSPINPKSIYPRGYNEMFGLVNNPQFKADPEKRLFRAHYRRLVGKAGLDNSAGWVATVNGASGCAFVERFQYFPDRKYPDDASVEFWMSGPGQYVVGPAIVDAKEDPVETPYLVESEVLSPFAELAPGATYSFHLDWFVARVGGNFPVVDCTSVGVTCVPLSARAAGGMVRLAGRFGVFYPAAAALVTLDAAGNECGKVALKGSVSPVAPLVLSLDEALPAEAETVCLVLTGASGKVLGELARTRVRR
jgi:hypothetical protein